MNILLIGGTGFLGRHLVTAAQLRRHHVTLFHRGKQAAADLTGVEEILGDRTRGLAALQNRQWDAVIDTCGYLPHTVTAMANALRHAVTQYVFISSLAAYADFTAGNYRETAPLAGLTPAQAERAAQLEAHATLTAGGLADLYGPLKARCEQQAQQVFGSSATLIVRPGVLVGPQDPTDRFTYWAQRVAAGGEVLAPGLPSRFVQFLDVRDLAAWLVSMVERQQSGVYNAASPPFTLSFGELLDTIKATTASQATLKWVDEEFLRQEQVEAWSELPLYLLESTPETAGFLAANVERARAAGLRFRSLRATIQETLAWRDRLPAPLKAGLSVTREQQLLATYALR